LARRDLALPLILLPAPGIVHPLSGHCSTGHRQQEIKRQRLLDEIFRQTMHVHQDTVDTYLEDILMESVDTASAQQSRSQVQEYVAKLEGIVDEVHKR
jgi:hypothetical protein